MENAIKLDNNKVIIDLVEIKDIAVSEVVKHLKALVYNNSVDVFYVLSDAYDNESDEYYFFKDFIKELRSRFNILLMLKTGYFTGTKFYDSVFALGVDAVTLSINGRDEASKKFCDTINYITGLWPKGAVFTDIIAVNCSDDEIKEKIAFYSELKVIPKIITDSGCILDADSGTPFCIRDFIMKSLKENSVSLKWVMNFELCSVLQKSAGGKGRSKRKIAGKVALELASLRRKLMVKEVRSSFDSASL
jgi:hypothetical protein